MILQLYTDRFSSHSHLLIPHTLVASVEYIKMYSEKANRQNFHVWNSHRRTTPYDRFILSNSWARCV